MMQAIDPLWFVCDVVDERVAWLREVVRHLNRKSTEFSEGADQLWKQSGVVVEPVQGGVREDEIDWCVWSPRRNVCCMPSGAYP